jgi:hypothetical protein
MTSVARSIPVIPGINRLLGLRPPQFSDAPAQLVIATRRAPDNADFVGCLWRDSAQLAAYGATRRNGTGGACLLCPGNSDINLFRYGKGIIDLNATVPNGTFNLCVPEQELHGAQIAGTPVDQGRLGPL